LALAATWVSEVWASSSRDVSDGILYAPINCALSLRSAVPDQVGQLDLLHSDGNEVGASDNSIG